MEKPQIIIAIENLGGGGAERVALELARHWPRENHRPVLLVAQRAGPYADQVPDDVEVLEVGVASSPRRIPTFFARLRILLRGRPVAGIVSHLPGMNRMLLRARLAGIVSAPVVVVEHNNFATFLAQQHSRWRAAMLSAEIGFLYRRAHGVVGCGEGVAGLLGRHLRIPEARLHAIVNPIAPHFLEPAPMAPAIARWFDALPRPVSVTAGRMVEEKGFADLIEAMAKGVPGSLVILGEGPLRAALEQRARGLGVAVRVAMPGFVERPEQVLQASDLYVSSSVSEGYPLSLVEAYASGLPVVARDCDFGPREIVTPDRPGALVTSPAPAALADAMIRTLATTPRFAPGTVVDLAQNMPGAVARRYRDLFK